MMEEWRPVPDFKRYEITESGKVRDRYSMALIRVHPTNGSVSLVRGNARYVRSVSKLVRLAYSDRSHPVLDAEGYKAVRGAPGYSVNREGNVFDEVRRQFLTSANGTVQLRMGDSRVHRTVKSIVQDTFG